ncbi:MAG: phosphatidate cytidylyltransferase [Clostridia bacterium]|nr:phosphatidate cytidylyltransferase [Clostridia bacterium]
MLVRVISAVVALCILVPVVYFSETAALPVAAAIVCCICLFEMLGCLKLRKNLWVSVPFYLVGIFAPIGMRYIQNKTLLLACLCACVGLLALIMLTVSVFSKRKIHTQQTSSMFMTGCYIIAAFTSIVYIRDSGVHGKILLVMMFAAPWVTDTFAYLFGRLLGKHKLIPEVSPKKTVEGSVAGIVFCTLYVMIFGFVCTKIWDVTCNYAILAVLGVVLSIVGQIGDLAMSVIKREYDIKDYGKIMPGHGGALDRFDSVLAVSIVVAAFEIFVDVFA